MNSFNDIPNLSATIWSLKTKSSTCAILSFRRSSCHKRPSSYNPFASQHPEILPHLLRNINFRHLCWVKPKKLSPSSPTIKFKRSPRKKSSDTDWDVINEYFILFLIFPWPVVLLWSFRIVFVVSVFRFGRFACFGGFVSLVSVVSFRSFQWFRLFRSFRFVVSGFSTCYRRQHCATLDWNHFA